MAKSDRPKYRLPRGPVCPECNGRGNLAVFERVEEPCRSILDEKPGCSPAIVPCKICGGNKSFVVNDRTFECEFCDDEGNMTLGIKGMYVPVCRACRGTGWYQKTERHARIPCRACNGTGLFEVAARVCNACRRPWLELPPKRVLGPVPRWDFRGKELADAPSGEGVLYRYVEAGRETCPTCLGTGELLESNPVLPDDFQMDAGATAMFFDLASKNMVEAAVTAKTILMVSGSKRYQLVGELDGHRLSRFVRQDVWESVPADEI